ncbi:MAG: anti-sigma factor [Dehalococcoidia bacterium]
MTCAQVDELLAAFALDAVTEDERDAIVGHLEGCALHEDLAELRAVTLALGVLAAEREPSPALEARVAALAAERPDTPRPASRTWASRARGLPALAAALAAIAVVLGGWSVLLQLDGEAGPSMVYVHETADAWMRVEGAGDTSDLAVAGLARLSEAEAYQLWAIRDGEWLAVGTFNTNPEARWQGEFAFALEPSDRVALTQEPAGGSTAPTSEPVLGTWR